MARSAFYADIWFTCTIKWIPGPIENAKWPGTAGKIGPLGKVRGIGVPGPVNVALPVSASKKGIGGAPGPSEEITVVQLVTLTDAWFGFVGTPRLLRP